MREEITGKTCGRILVVDDTTSNLQLLTNLLTEHGYTVYPASDGELALEFVRTTLPDLILLDIRMPGMDGYEVCRRLKADDRTRAVPVIFISILEDERDKVKGFREGAVDYISKPFQPEEVLARIQTRLRLRELTERLEQQVCERTEELTAANERLQKEMEERRKMEQQLLQAQKMEAVGLLAGGVAHDFNNLLTPIFGYTEMLMLGFSVDDRRYQRLQQVKQAAERAKELTQRLLTFSRKQVIELKTVNLGDIIRQIENMLQRTIRENIRIEVRISPSLSLVRADAGQIEQVLLNLSINAQDAMPEGGVLSIEAQDIDLDESYADTPLEIKPGCYVMLTVSDTGVGMDKETQEHIFEPFFTTKELGKGTGLGLSTVYGIIKQHDGSISVYSEKNRGSVFKIFFPRVDEGKAAFEKAKSFDEAAACGTETVLVVEDNEMVRTLACIMLEDLGYRVFPADNVEQCLDFAKEYQGAIHMLLTDVVMPKLNGKELFSLLSQIRPELKVLYMSGYASNVIGHHGVLDEGVHFIQKPFSIQVLSQKVRDALES